MTNKTAKLYEKILAYERENKIKELGLLAYSLVTKMSQDIKLREDAGAIVVKSQLDTGLKEFREQINIILTENPLMPLDEADKRLRDRMADNAEQAVDMIDKILNAIALTVAILKQKVGTLEGQLNDGGIKYDQGLEHLQNEIILYSEVTRDGNPRERFTDALGRLRGTTEELIKKPYELECLAECFMTVVEVSDRAGIPAGLLIRKSMDFLNEKRNNL